MEFEYRVTMIIPVYNVALYLKDCLDSLVAQTISQEDMEVLMINDGSTDGSLEICEQYAKAYENFKVLSQENQGVSAARNYGIRNAKGKYLMYLDGDDTLSAETVKNVIDFFDEHYDEVDLVTYPLTYHYEDGSVREHERYKTLNHTDIFSLTHGENAQISLSLINVCVKNCSDAKLFSESLKMSEDQLYVMEILCQKGVIGFVKEADYKYLKHRGAATDLGENPYFCSKDILTYFEALLEFKKAYPDIGEYIDNLIIYNLNWRTSNDLIFPHHFSTNELNKYIKNISKTLISINDEAIVNHPQVDIYHKFYLLNLKYKSNEINVYCGTNKISICHQKILLAIGTSITAVFTKIRITGSFVEWSGFLKSPFFLFSDKPELFIQIKAEDGIVTQPLTLLDSAHGYYKSKIKTAQFWRFQFRVPSTMNATFELCASLYGYTMKLKYYFMPDLSFKTNARCQSFFNEGVECRRNGISFSVSEVSPKREKKIKKSREKWYWKHHKKLWLVRRLSTLRKASGKRIWLYCDSTGVGKDNGYYQFIHDIKEDDGIIRYYITHEKSAALSDNFKDIPKESIVLFNSKRHKFLYLQCEKVITAYVERYNYIPFDPETYGHYRDINDPEIIYLQHGVLHAHLPHKYSLDRLNIDREVVSTSYEIENLTGQYHFRKENLIPAGMPRYDYIDAEKIPQSSTKKILMAPSWRQYLITLRDGGEWHPEHDLFEKSLFYQNIRSFLESEELAEILERYNYTLDFKLHPIFKCYREHFTFSNPRIRLSETNIDPAEYTAYISDFSSFTFDFVYLKRAIIYFFPDYDMFRAGLMSYRELDIPLEGGFGPLTQNVDDAVHELEAILRDNGKPDELYQRRMENFFLFYDNSQCDRIYQSLISQEKVTITSSRPQDMLK